METASISEVQASQPSRPVNQFESSLTNQGISFDIPKKFINPLLGKPDRLTQLPVENDELRAKLASSIGRSILSGKKWAVINGDVDNLKFANKKHRQFGDMVIRYGSAKVTQSVAGVELNEGASATAIRLGYAADETVVVLTDLTDEDVLNLEKAVSTTNEPTQIADPSFTLSVSAVMITSDDQRLAEMSEGTKKWLEENPGRAPFDFYTEIMRVADDDANLLKIAKDLNRLPVEELLSADGVSDYINVLVRNLGQSRISEELLETTYKLVSIKSVMHILETVKGQAAYTLLLKELGVSDHQIKNATTAQDLINLFQDMFGKAD